jgi:hypothetical protein
MEKIKAPILVVSLILLFYTITPFIGIPYQITSFLFAISPLLVIWMVIRILKDGRHSGKTWSEGFRYEND